MILTNEKLREALKDTRDFNNIRIIKEIAYSNEISSKKYFTNTNSPMKRKKDFGCGTYDSKKSIRSELSNLSILSSPAGIKSIRNRNKIDFGKSLSSHTDQNNVNLNKILIKSKAKKNLFIGPMSQTHISKRNIELPYLCLTPEREKYFENKQNPSKVCIEKEINFGEYFLNKPKLKIKKFKKLKDVMKMEYYQKNMNGLKDKINRDKILAEFQRLRNDIYKNGQKTTNIIIKNFLYKNGIFDISVFNIRNFDNLLYFLKDDFHNKIDCKKTIKEIVIDVLNGQLL